MSDCLFCKIIAGEIPSTKVYEDEIAYACLDIAPLKPGHTLVVPKTHVTDALADAQVLGEIAPSIVAVGRLLTERLGADGMNMVSNVGEVSGQSVFHLHVHLVPRFASKPGFAALVDGDDVDMDAVKQQLGL